MADYAAHVEDYPVFPPIEPGSLAGLFPAEPPEGPAPARRDPRRLPGASSSRTRRTGSTRGSWPTSRRPASAAGILGEMLIGGAQPERDAVADLADRHGAGIGRRRLAPPGPRPAGRVRRAHHRHGLDLVAHRPGRGSRRGRLPRRERRASPAARSSGRPGSMRRRRPTRSIEKACMTLGLGRSGLVKIPTDDRYGMRRGRAGGGHRGGSRRRPAADRHRGDDRDDVVDLDRPGRRHRRRRGRARASGSTSMPPTRGRSRCSRSGGRRSPAGSAPTRSSSTRTSGSSRRWTPRCC